MRHYPTVDESMDRLRRAGWSVGDHACGPLWHVTGSNGENSLSVSAARGRVEAAKRLRGE